MSNIFHIGENSIGLAMANELVLAYSERRQAIGQTAVASFAGDEDPRNKTIWREMQDWLEIYCVSFVNHVSGPVNPTKTGFLYFTLATWRAIAGIHPDGFYRRDSNNKEKYGKIEKDDFRIKENFVELQKAFSVLRWCPHNPTSSINQCKGNAFLGFPPWGSSPGYEPIFNYFNTVTEAKTDAESYYTSFSPADHYNAPEAYKWIKVNEQGKYAAGIVRLRREDTFDFGEELSANTVEVYLISNLFFVGYETFDNQDDAALEEEIFKMVLSQTYVPGMVLNIFETWDSPPRWPSIPSGSLPYSRGYVTYFSGYYPSFLIKWNFTNA